MIRKNKTIGNLDETKDLNLVLAAIVIFSIIAVVFLSPGAAAHIELPEIIEQKAGNWDEIKVSDGFILINNMWSTVTDTEQKIILYEDGSYGWEWERGGSGLSEPNGEGPNYPEVLLGVKPWGTHDFTEGVLPLKLKDIESLVMEMDVVYEIFEDSEGAGNWNLSFEMWLTMDKPGTDVSGSITDEIMIWFDWQEGLWDWDDPVDAKAVDDGYHLYEYNVSREGWGGQGYFDDSWHYSQFRIVDQGTIPKKVDLKPFLDYIQKELDRTDEVWLGALELGMEYEAGTAGMTRIVDLNYEINGQRLESGVNRR